jgi:hypothetical protein
LEEIETAGGPGKRLHQQHPFASRRTSSTVPAATRPSGRVKLAPVPAASMIVSREIGREASTPVAFH